MIVLVQTMSCVAFITVFFITANVYAQLKNGSKTEIDASPIHQIMQQILPYPLLPVDYFQSEKLIRPKPGTPSVVNFAPQRNDSNTEPKKKPFPKRSGFLQYNAATKKPFPKRVYENNDSALRGVIPIDVPTVNYNTPQKYLRQDIDRKEMKMQENNAVKQKQQRNPDLNDMKQQIKLVSDTSDQEDKDNNRNEEGEDDIDVENQYFKHETDDVEQEREIENIKQKYKNEEDDLKVFNENEQIEAEKPEEKSEALRTQKIADNAPSTPKPVHKRMKYVYQEPKNVQKLPRNQYQAPKIPYRATLIDYGEDTTERTQLNNIFRTSDSSDESVDSDNLTPNLRNGEGLEDDDEDLHYALDGTGLRHDI